MARQSQRPQLLVALGDNQAPYHDTALHGVVLDWLKDNKPDLLVCTGDLLDFPTISKHALRKGYVATPPDVIEAGQSLLRDYQRAAPKAKRWLVPGNHEQRLEAYLYTNADKLVGMDIFTDTLVKALRLSTLGYAWVSNSNGGPDWPHALLKVTPQLGIAHGWIVRKQSGASAVATIEHLGHSCIVGHTHRQALVSHTYHELAGSVRVVYGCEAGTLATLRGGLGYAVAPNWQQGFATAWLWPDSSFNLGLATYVNGRLTWGSERWDSRQPVVLSEAGRGDLGDSPSTVPDEEAA